MVSSFFRSSFARALALLLALPLACGDDDGEASENESVEHDNGWATRGMSDSATSTSTTETSTTASTSGSDSTAAASSTAAEGSTGPGEPVPCTEELTCNPGMICVLPCCGGPAPGCYSVEAGRTCFPGDTPIEDGSCCRNDPDPAACMMMQWCFPGPCTADPPFCTPRDTITCNGTSCDAPDGCYGQLTNDQLQCSCK
ncbi:hypothetical protein [Paraliomyxa miuraensis]|uniref:hypothetical protein n=1 Tax=Paraliomyxa miuraensis TaxID=376150 RepID=UPI002251A897|nr:hypothetical protein [Paraliomyxa miuraensis]MCX4242061.1 hypothetical protein [Paraliomyxa miuraensis]